MEVRIDYTSTIQHYSLHKFNKVHIGAQLDAICLSHGQLFGISTNLS
jgi:hypothetical protein